MSTHPFTFELIDIASKKPAKAYKPGMSIKLGFSSSPETTLRQHFCPDEKDSRVSVAVEIDAFDGAKRIANWTSTIPDMGGGKEGRFHIWIDPAASGEMFEVWDETVEFRNYIFNLMKQPKAYKLAVKVSVRFGKSVDVAALELPWDVSGDRAEAWTTALRIIATGGAEKVRMQEPGMRDAALEREMTAILAKKFPEVKKVVIISRDWNIVRNDVGVILRRTLDAQVAWRAADGTHWIEDATFAQEASGPNSWQKLVSFGGGSGKAPIVAANIPA